jgi:proteic killer suppression protein
VGEKIANLKIMLDDNNVIRYYSSMIKTLRDKETEKIFCRAFSRRLPHAIQKVAMRKLWMLDAATDLNSLRVPPSNHLEALHGDREGQYSIRINRQLRICFKWHKGDAYDVEIVDYH